MEEKVGMEQLTGKTLLDAEGISSEAQKDLTKSQLFVRSSLFFVIIFEALLITIFGVLSPDNAFFNVSNLFNVALNASQMIILSVGVTFLITAGDFDLSIGMNLVLSSTIAARVFKNIAGSPEEIARSIYPRLAEALLLGIFISMLIGIVGGILNGFFTTKLNLPPFIATLASMNIFQGIAMVICNGAQETGIPRVVQYQFGHARLFDVIPYPLILALLIGLLLHLVMKYTRFGLYIRALGSNRESARRAGINVTRYRYFVYILVGICASVAGLIDIARFATTNPAGHTSDGLMAVMAVVMGGTSIKGGVASVSGSVLASLIPVTLQIGMVVLRISSYYQMIATGLFLALAVYMDYRRTAKSTS